MIRILNKKECSNHPNFYEFVGKRSKTKKNGIHVYNFYIKGWFKNQKGKTFLRKIYHL